MSAPIGRAIRLHSRKDLRAARRRRSHHCWDHLIAAPLWPLHGVNLGTLLRTCDAVGACLAVPPWPWVDEALARGNTLRRAACVHRVGDPLGWLTRHRAAGTRVLGVELAEDAIRLADLPAARCRTVAVLGHEQTGIPPDVADLLDEAMCHSSGSLWTPALGRPKSPRPGRLDSHLMANLEKLLEQRLAAGFAGAAGEPADPVLRRSQRADFQADGALALARRLGGDPRSIAAKVLHEVDLDDLCSSIEVAGPGFLNLTIDDGALGRLLARVGADERLGVPAGDSGETVVVDYSAPNVAKEMHVGHLRSTVIGDAAVRLLEWLGHSVVRVNHLGDWGTPFGMLIEHLLDVGEAEAAHELSVGDLDSFYRAARAKFDADVTFQERARRRVVALQSGDEATGRLWRMLVEESKNYFLRVYERLDVRLSEADFFGESRYNDMLVPLVDELDRLGLLRDSEGARCVFPGGFTNREGDPLPMIVRKRDGGFGYAATDLAAIRYRARNLRATRLLYVVGLPQRRHFEMVYDVARAAGWLRPPVRAEHIGFGSVLGSDGRMLRSRVGGSVKLIDLLDEAVARAGAIVAAKNPELDERTRARVARAVGIGAVKYADLSTDRVKDYVFDLDRMLSFDGNTAAYLQFAHARICSIYRRADVAPARVERVSVHDPAERALALELLMFGGVLDRVAESLEFHRLANYLHGLAVAFTAFYERCPVLRAEGAVRDSRLVLCDVTARTLALGLGLLGIEAPQRM